MNKRLFTILAGIFAVMSFAACNDDEGIDPSAAEPTITYAYDTLEADLNVVDNLPVVAIVKSEAGLKSVSLSINTSDGETVPVTTVTEFFNVRSYSLAEEINYESNYTEAVIEAVDLLGRKAEAKMPISIIDVVEAPSIVFTPAKWSYDETVGGEKPHAHRSEHLGAVAVDRDHPREDLGAGALYEPDVHRRRSAEIVDLRRNDRVRRIRQRLQGQGR